MSENPFLEILLITYEALHGLATVLPHLEMFNPIAHGPRWAGWMNPCGPRWAGWMNPCGPRWAGWMNPCGPRWTGWMNQGFIRAVPVLDESQKMAGSLALNSGTANENY